MLSTSASVHSSYWARADHAVCENFRLDPSTVTSVFDGVHGATNHLLTLHHGGWSCSWSTAANSNSNFGPSLRQWRQTFTCLAKL